MKLYIAAISRYNLYGPSLMCLYVIPSMPGAVCMFLSCINGDDILYGDWLSERLGFVDVMFDAKLQCWWS